MDRKVGDDYDNRSDPDRWHPLKGSYHGYRVLETALAPKGLHAVLRGSKDSDPDDLYAVTHVVCISWFSSGDHQVWGSLIVYDGRVEIAEKLNRFKRVMLQPKEM